MPAALAAADPKHLAPARSVAAITATATWQTPLARASALSVTQSL